MRNKLNISIIGGCALTQKNIPKESRFYSVFNKRMVNDLEIDTSISFASYTNYNNLEAIIKRMILKKKSNIIILQIRPQPFLILTKPIIRGNNPSKLVNPLLYSSAAFNHNEKEISPVFNTLAKKPIFMNTNMYLGKLFRLKEKASKHILDTIKNIQSVCNESDIKLFILGIPPQLMTKQTNNNCKFLDDYLYTNCCKNGIKYITTFKNLNENKYFEKDKVHFSEAGHIMLGEIMFQEFNN